MVGVANPLFRQNRRQGASLLLGLGGGFAAASLLLALVVLALGAPAQTIAASHREAALAVVLAVLAMSDVLNRTPHVWRQVPQRFIAQLPAGPRGLIWGADLGLLVTTQKTSSLLWAGLAAAVLVASPAEGVSIVATGAAAYWLGTALASVLGGDRTVGALLAASTYVRHIRMGTGAVLMTLAASTGLGVWA